MIGELQHTGEWWLPEEPDKKVHGELNFTPGEGAVLLLEGSFNGLQVLTTISRASELIAKPKIILGTSREQKRITLYKCFGVRGFPICSFRAFWVFEGEHFQTVKDLRFASLSTHYSYVGEWVGRSGLKLQTPPTTVVYESPGSYEAKIKDDLQMSIHFRAPARWKIGPPSEVSIKEEAWITIRATEGRPLEDVLRNALLIEVFLSLAIGYAVRPLAIERITATGHKVRVLYRLPDVPRAPETLVPQDMLFTLADVRDRLETVLSNWFDKAGLLENVYQLYSGTLSNPHMFAADRFLSLVQAIESYHRRMYGGKYLPDEDYQKAGGLYEALVRAIPDGVDKDHRTGLRERLKYAHEFSLRKRLQEIFKQHEALTELVQDRDRFVDKVVTTRNYLTHYDEADKERAATGAALGRLVETLRRLLELCLLTQVGFSSEEVKAKAKALLPNGMYVEWD